MLWDVFPVATLVAVGVGPFALAYLGHAVVGFVLPAGYLLFIALIADEQPPGYDMPGFGTKLLLVGGLIAGAAWTGGLIGGRIRARLRRTN
jgi:hypothetical protein